MATLYKRNTLTKTITLMAMMAAINVILSLICAYVPFLSVVLIIFLPLTSALVEVSCKDRYFPIYAFGTLGLCMAATFHIIDFAIIYIIPSIITGYLFGLMGKKKVAPIWSVFFATIAQTIFTFILLPLLDLITEINFIDYTITLLNLNNIENIKDYAVVAVFAIALVQIILSYIVCESELRKLGLNSRKYNVKITLLATIDLLSIILSVSLFFAHHGIGYLFTLFSWFFACFIIYEIAKQKKFVKLVIFGVGLLCQIFFFAIINPLISDGQFLLIGFAPLVIGITSFFGKNHA